MRILYAGDGNELRGVGGEQPESVAGRRQGGRQWTPVPLRHLSTCIRGNARRCDNLEGLIMPGSETELRKYPVGIDATALVERCREVSADEAPPLAPNARLS